MNILKDEYGYWKDWVVIAGTAVGVLVLVACLLPVVTYGFGLASIPFQVGQCQTLTDIDPAHEYKWVFWGGCLVQTSTGRWIDPDSLDQMMLDLEGS